MPMEPRCTLLLLRTQCGQLLLYFSREFAGWLITKKTVILRKMLYPVAQ